MANVTSLAQNEPKETWHIPPWSLLDLKENEQAEVKFLTYEDWIIKNEKGYNAVGSGVDFYFYSDSTFQIRSWQYGASSGFNAEYINGKYLNTSENEITLTIEPKFNTTPFDKHRLYVGVFRGYSQVFLEILTQIDNRIKINMYAHDIRGDKSPLLRATLIRKLTAKDKEK